MTVCVWGALMNGERRKDRSEGTKAGIHIAAPLPCHDYTIQTFFLYHSKACFFPVCSMNYVNDKGILFFPPCGRMKKKKKRLKREKCLLFISPLLHPSLLRLPVNLSCWRCGPGVPAPRPCERLTVAAWARGGGRGRVKRTMTYMKS